ncbi:unnamed protein product [Vitrella brassicaformis CCMP3155]|uniref:Uncharacterized protein n=1 Tax=Vitrella brassicaformis (strain CCMP3155) TaxID=1169540 RepID=A0A0G4EDG7_VITBC|nr:unnamed protein product [Vitrella brassicaformis CCMP3155]|eukprot:CEL93401.1 unnamed protein product [Vitrella brassicaformis CCMP3155]
MPRVWGGAAGISLIYTACYVAWLWSPTEEFSVQLGEKISLDQLSGRALLIDVVIGWLLCTLSPVCLVIVCLLIWSELMHVLVPVDGRVGYLLRVLYVIEEGGCWNRCVSLIHLLKNSSHVLPSLPIVITAYDLQQAGAGAVFSSRPQAVRQYSLFGHRLSVVSNRRVSVICLNGRDYLGGSADTNALTYVSIDLTDPDPPTKCGKYAASSFTDIIVVLLGAYNGMDPRLRPHFTHPCELITPPPTQYRLTEDIILHSRGKWNGCRKAVYWVDEANVLRHAGIFILCGDKAADRFLVCIDFGMKICSTEPPVAWKSRPDERYPRTAALIRQKAVAA